VPEKFMIKPSLSWRYTVEALNDRLIADHRLLNEHAGSGGAFEWLRPSCPFDVTMAGSAREKSQPEKKNLA